MIYQRGHLARPLDAFFSCASRVATLRALYKSKEPCSGRAVARAARLSHQAAANALLALAALGVVRRSGVGKETRWSLDRNGFLGAELLDTVFEAEEAYAPSVVQAFKSHLGYVCARAFLYGDAAKGRLAPGGILRYGVIPGKKGRRAASEAMRALDAQFKSRWGLRAEGRLLSENEGILLAIQEQSWMVLPDEGGNWTPQ